MFTTLVYHQTLLPILRESYSFRLLMIYFINTSLHIRYTLNGPANDRSAIAVNVFSELDVARRMLSD
jgi:hypothetical protein